MIRYASRCLMIEFTTPALSLSLSEYIELGELWENCLTCVGFCISLGEKFFIDGIREIDEIIRPNLSSHANSNVSPRVIPSYFILYWFCLQVHDHHYS